MELTPKQQTSEAIRQAETILITTGQHPTVDQIAATLALAAILRKFGKKVSAIISDPLPGPAQFLDTAGLDKSLSGLRDFVLKLDVTKAEVDKLRYEVEGGKLNIYITPFKGGFAPSDVTFGYGDYHFDLAIVLGVASRSRIDRVYAENSSLFGAIPLVNIDFHRTNENYGAINLIEPTASSLCEILVALSESLQAGMIDSEIATVMLAGLMASTDRFTASHTTSKSLTVAAQMMAAGAKQGVVVRGLFNRGEGRERSDRNERGNERQREERRPENVRKEPVQMQQRVEPRPEQPREEQRPVEEAMIMQPAPAVEMAPRMEQPMPSAHPAELLEPNHIELMPMEESPVEMAQEAPTQPLPMADFAAAAEVLRQRDDEDERSDDRSDDRSMDRRDDRA